MLETTFIGHQGWMFATANARILIDPLLVEGFGHNGGVGVVYPPRQIDIAAMPPVDAVVYTHEHEDHFNIPSINRLSRDIPIYIPARSSHAMRQILAEAGFRVHLMSPGRAVAIGDLKLTPFSPDHVRHDEQDEWDTLAFLVEDLKDRASFFSPVDLTVSGKMEHLLRQLRVAPTLWGYANNVLNLSAQEQPPQHPPAVQPIIARFVAEHQRRTVAPKASLMCGGGFSFTGSRSWMNASVFPLDSVEMFQGMQAALPDERFIVPTPGMRITAERSGVKDVAETSAFLKPLPKAQWPDRAYKPETKPSSTVEPASGRSALRPGELEELTQRLADFAAFLYGGSLFRSLYSFTDSALPEGVRPVFAINAMSGDQDHVFEYDPTGPAFTLLAKPSSMSGYVAAVECFATDLLEFLQGRIAPSALMFGRLLRWRAPPENLTAAIDRAIWLYGHPLRRPSAYLDLYRSIYANEARDVPKVQARRA